MTETTEEKIRRVAGEIQELLVKERLALIPTLSLQEVPEPPPIITP